MFDGAETNGVGGYDGETVASHELEWRSVHQTLRDLARRRVEMEAEECTYLLEAEDLRIFNKLSYRSMVEYMVGELGYTRHAANERLRVARELLALPKIAAAFGDGALCWAKVRELTRVVTPETEAAFLAEAVGKDSHQVARLVSGLRRGDRPDAIRDPALVTSRVVFELHAEAMSLLACRTRDLKAELGREPTHDEIVISLCTTSTGDRPRTATTDGRGSTGDRPRTAADGPGSTGDHAVLNLKDQTSSTGDRALIVVIDERGSCTTENAESKRRQRIVIPPPGAQQLFTTCKHCARSELLVEGQALAIDRTTAERLACDVELVGDADSDDNSRVTSAIPAGIRRNVFMRDAFCCVVPGCTARKHLDIHHIRHRENGGTHTMSNCAVLCFQHHKAHHDGLLEISGVAPHRLEFNWKGDAGPTWDDRTK